jgi:hypothetical protein
MIFGPSGWLNRIKKLRIRNLKRIIDDQEKHEQILKGILWEIKKLLFY